jgi:hypothetical protein
MIIYKHQSKRSLDGRLRWSVQHARASGQPTHGMIPLPSGNQIKNRWLESCPRDLLTPILCPFVGARRACPVRAQAKLTVSQPNDPYEQEADRVAEQVMSMPETRIQRACPSCENEILQKKPLADQLTPLVQRQEEKPEEEEEPVQAKREGGNPLRLTSDANVRIQSLRGGGAPLPPSPRSFFERRFGCDFGDVRVHSDSQASEAAKSVRAQAFTFGHDIVFGQNQYSPESPDGKKLLAHELSHVIQQHASLQSTTPHTGIGAVDKRDVVQRYKLRGFPPTEKAAMKAAIPLAIATIKKCKYLSRFGKYFIPRALQKNRYDYKKNLGYCGWTFPSAWYIEVGKDAFNPKICCDLASTLAHEAAHVSWYIESRARKMECKCFGCSC